MRAQEKTKNSLLSRERSMLHSQEYTDQLMASLPAAMSFGSKTDGLAALRRPVHNGSPQACLEIRLLDT